MDIYPWISIHGYSSFNIHPRISITGIHLDHPAVILLGKSAKHSAAAGPDCCATAFRKKMRKYYQLLEPMARDGVSFRPIVVSAEGRPHPVVHRIVAFAAGLASRKHPDASARLFA